MRYEELSARAQEEAFNRFFPAIRREVRDATGPIFTEEEIKTIFLNRVAFWDFLEDGTDTVSRTPQQPS